MFRGEGIVGITLVRMMFVKTEPRYQSWLTDMRVLQPLGL